MKFGHNSLKRVLPSLLKMIPSGSQEENTTSATVSTAESNQENRAGSCSCGGPVPESFTNTEQKWLLDLAASALNHLTTNGAVPEVNIKEAPPKLAQDRACFVTLMKAGKLRGCVGHILPREPLCQAVVDTVLAAASRDSRFPPIQADEVPHVGIEISVLTEPRPLVFHSPAELLNQLHPREDGVVLQIGSHSATFLPKVWEQIPDPVQFLNRLAEKAGCAASAWRGPETSVLVYHTEVFGHLSSGQTHRP